jgi:hypothetical protein
MADKKRIRYTPIELVLNYIKEVSSTIFIVFIFILRFVGVILLIEVVLWRVGVVLSSDPRQICLVTFACFIISIGVRRLGVSIIVPILYIKAALDV